MLQKQTWVNDLGASIDTLLWRWSQEVQWESKTRRKESQLIACLQYVGYRAHYHFGQLRLNPTSATLRLCEHTPKDPGNWSTDLSTPTSCWWSISPGRPTPLHYGQKTFSGLCRNSTDERWGGPVEYECTENVCYTVEGMTVRNKIWSWYWLIFMYSMGSTFEGISLGQIDLDS